jgi:LysM repeat protein
MQDMKVTVDITMGGVGMDESKIQSKGAQPMMDMPSDAASGDPKYEIGYDAGVDSKDWNGKFEEYVVQEGDTLESIAQDKDLKPKEIALLNRKEGRMMSDQVNVGQKLLIPVIENTDPAEDQTP